MKDFTFSFPNLDLVDFEAELQDADLHAIEQQALVDRNYFLGQPGFKRLHRENSFRLINEKVIMLRAHGPVTSQTGDEYGYHDGKRTRLVQDWINENDGKANTLILMVCCKPHLSIKSEKSLVIHPFGSISPLSMMRKERLRMFVPRYGYVENNRALLNKAIKELC